MMPAHRKTLRLSEMADVLGYSSSTCRRLVANGTLPAPIDPTLSPKLRRWSRPLIERYAGVTLDPEPTPAHGMVRPDLRVVGE